MSAPMVTNYCCRALSGDVSEPCTCGVCEATGQGSARHCDSLAKAQAMVAGARERADATPPGPWTPITYGYADTDDQLGHLRRELEYRREPDAPPNTDASWVQAGSKGEVWAAFVGNGPRQTALARFIASARTDVPTLAALAAAGLALYSAVDAAERGPSRRRAIAIAGARAAYAAALAAFDAVVADVTGEVAVHASEREL